jgi:hypothetical protein
MYSSFQKYVFVSSIFISTLICTPQISLAQNSLQSEAYQSIERGLAWIRTQVQQGSFDGWVTGLGGLALMEQRVSSDPVSRRKGYRYSNLVDRQLLIQMANFIIDSDPAFQDSPVRATYETAINLLFLAHFRRTGGPNQVGASQSVERALTLGTSKILDLQGMNDPCNVGGWNSSTPLNSGDLVYSYFVLHALSGIDRYAFQTRETLPSILPFLTSVWREGQGFIRRPCQAHVPTPSMTTLGTLALRIAGHELNDEWVQNSLGRVQAEYDPTGSHLMVSSEKYLYLWSLSSLLTLTESRFDQQAPLNSNQIGGIRTPSDEGYIDVDASWQSDLILQLLESQNLQGFWDIEGNQGFWRRSSMSALALLTLENSLSGLCADEWSDQDGVCQDGDVCPDLNNPNQLD